MVQRCSNNVQDKWKKRVRKFWDRIILAETWKKALINIMGGNINSFKVINDFLFCLKSSGLSTWKKLEHIRIIFEKVRNSWIQKCQACVKMKGGHVEKVSKLLPMKNSLLQTFEGNIAGIIRGNFLRVQRYRSDIENRFTDLISSRSSLPISNNFLRRPFWSAARLPIKTKPRKRPNKEGNRNKTWGPLIQFRQHCAR